MRGRLEGVLPWLLALSVGVAGAVVARGPLLAAHSRLPRVSTPLYFPSSQGESGASREAGRNGRPRRRPVQLVAVGQEATLADLLYLWSIQYFGDETLRVEGRPEWTERVYGTITDIDPRFRDAYWLGYVSLLVEESRPDAAFALADKALAEDPGFTWMAIEAALTARERKLDDRMIHYLELGSAAGDPLAERFLARLRIVDWTQQELGAWDELLDSSDELTRSIARSHVDDLRVVIDVATLEALARCYRAERGMTPASLEQLVATGYLAELPLDPDGNAYAYDAHALTVTSTRPFRQRPPSRATRGVDLSMLGRCAPPPAPPEAPAAPSPSYEP